MHPLDSDKCQDVIEAAVHDSAVVTPGATREVGGASRSLILCMIVKVQIRTLQVQPRASSSVYARIKLINVVMSIAP